MYKLYRRRLMQGFSYQYRYNRPDLASMLISTHQYYGLNLMQTKCLGVFGNLKVNYYHLKIRRV